jgi:Na+-transporting methylmalonyl-CoA/oxaloacetate decarboxylase gamma subunit
MPALFANELFLGLVIVLLILGIVVAKTVGFKKFFGWFRSSSKRAEEAKAKTAEAKAKPATADAD